MQINTGIPEARRIDIAEALKRTLADTYTLYLKTHNYHWNVEGPMFNTLHLMFEQHYNEMWTAVDALAERIRALGVYAPGSYRAFAELSSIRDGADVPPPAEDMIADLVEGHETLIRNAREALTIAGEADDAATEDLLTVRIEYHEKTAWMLRSLLK